MARFDFRTGSARNRSGARQEQPPGTGGCRGGPPPGRRRLIVVVSTLGAVLIGAGLIFAITAGGFGPGRPPPDQSRPAAPPPGTGAAVAVAQSPGGNEGGDPHSGKSPLVPQDETAEAALVRLSATWDTAFANRDETLLRTIFDPTYPGIDDEIANMHSPENHGTPTPVDNIQVESQEPGRVILVATFAYDEGPVRQRVLLVGSGFERRIAGVQDLEA